MRRKNRDKAVGLAVFIAGALMLGAVLWLAIGRISGGESALPALFRANPGAPIDIGPERPEKEDFTDDALIQAAQGVWLADMKDGRATLQIQKDTFQILFVPFTGPEKGWRLFSLGDLEVKDHFLVLAPRNDPAPPKGLDPALKNFSHPLTLRAFAVEARLDTADSGKNAEMTWKKGPGTYNGVHDVPMFHPLFEHSGTANGEILWRRAPAPPPATEKKAKPESPDPSPAPLESAPDAGTP